MLEHYYIRFDYYFVILDSERKLDTLPEEKIVPTTPTATTNSTNTQHFNKNTTNANNNSNNNNNNSNNCNNKNSNNYKRVYPDWKPSNTLEHTDVVGTIQAIAGMGL